MPTGIVAVAVWLSVTNKGVTQSLIKILVAITIPPLILILSMEGKLEAGVVGLLGALIGSVMSNHGKDQQP
jgi:Na+/H+ antiporter NhaA